MLTLLIVVMFAKFGYSAHNNHHNHELQTLILDTLYGPEHLRIIMEPGCTSVWKHRPEDVICKPRERIIPIGNQFIPNAIKVNRCSGTCGFTKEGQCPEQCHSVERRNVTFTAYKVKNNKRACVSITIEEDVECQCKQKTMFVQRGKLWDKKTCQFVCPKKLCTTGTKLDENSCRCVMKRKAKYEN